MDILGLIFLFVWLIALGLCVYVWKQESTIERLRRDLAKAQRNDHRDPKTGRFKKAK